jgi:nitroreductase
MRSKVRSLLQIDAVENREGTPSETGSISEGDSAEPAAPVLQCLRERQSVFARSFVDRSIDRSVVQSLLNAAMWAPYHGSVPPWRYVVLGPNAFVEMQKKTLEYYDVHWRDHWGTEEQYQTWRQRIEGEITGRWGPVSFMIGIVMRRQAGSKRMPEWEEAAAVAASVQNMHVQASAFPGLACYWSSWHSAFRDSDDMRRFLEMGAEDKCMGFLVVAACEPGRPDRRKRDPDTHLNVEWRD